MYLQLSFPFTISQGYAWPVQCHLTRGEVWQREVRMERDSSLSRLWSKSLTLENTGAIDGPREEAQASKGSRSYSFISTSISISWFTHPLLIAPWGKQDVHEIWPLWSRKKFQLEHRSKLVTPRLHLIYKCVFIWPVQCFLCFRFFLNKWLAVKSWEISCYNLYFLLFLEIREIWKTGPAFSQEKWQLLR